MAVRKIIIKPPTYLYHMPAALDGALFEERPNYLVKRYIGGVNFRPHNVVYQRQKKALYQP